MNKIINVKSYVKKGNLVRASKRKINNNKNNIIKTSTIIASGLGITLSTYLLLKHRYINNLNKSAINLKANKNIGKVLNSNIKDMTFTIGGLGGNTEHENPFNQAKYMVAQMKRIIGIKDLKQHEIIPLSHNFTFPLTNKEIINSTNRVKYLSSPLFKGINTESVKLAEDIYCWHIKNPTKPINILAFSAGTNMSRDVKFILNKKGVNNIKIVTLGASDFRLIPHDNKILSLMGTKDSVRNWKSPNAVMVDVDLHRPDVYLKNKEVQEKIRAHFY